MRDAGKDPLRKELGNFAKVKENSFYRKVIENLGSHKSKHFLSDEWVVSRVLRPTFFDDWEEIGETCEIKDFKQICYD